MRRLVIVGFLGSMLLAACGYADANVARASVEGSSLVDAGEHVAIDVTIETPHLVDAYDEEFLMGLELAVEAHVDAQEQPSTIVVPSLNEEWANVAIEPERFCSSDGCSVHVRIIVATHVASPRELVWRLDSVLRVYGEELKPDPLRVALVGTELIVGSSYTLTERVNVDTAAGTRVAGVHTEVAIPPELLPSDGLADPQAYLDREVSWSGLPRDGSLGGGIWNLYDQAWEEAGCSSPAACARRPETAIALLPVDRGSNAGRITVDYDLTFVTPIAQTGEEPRLDVIATTDAARVVRRRVAGRYEAEMGERQIARVRVTAPDRPDGREAIAVVVIEIAAPSDHTSTFLDYPWLKGLGSTRQTLATNEAGNVVGLVARDPWWLRCTGQQCEEVYTLAPADGMLGRSFDWTLELIYVPWTDEPTGNLVVTIED